MPLNPDRNGAEQERAKQPGKGKEDQLPLKPDKQQHQHAGKREQHRAFWSALSPSNHRAGTTSLFIRCTPMVRGSQETAEERVRGEKKKGRDPNPGKIRTYSKPTPLGRCYCAMSRVVPPFCPMLGKRAVGPNSKRHLQLERKTEYDRKNGYYPARNPVFNHLPSYPDRRSAAGPASPFIWRAFADRHSRQSFHFCSHASVRALGEDRSRRYRRGIQQANCAAAALWLRDRSRHCRTPGSGYLFMRTRALGYRRFPAIFSSSVFGSRWLLCTRTLRRDCLPRLFASSHGNGLGNVARPGCYWNFLYAGARCGWLELVSRPAGTTRRSASFRH